MRILQISDLAPPNIGGIEKVVWIYSKKLKERGNDVKIFTSLIPGTKKMEIIDGIEFERVSKISMLFRTNHGNFDIIHSHSYLSSYALSIEKKLKKKLL